MKNLELNRIPFTLLIIMLLLLVTGHGFSVEKAKYRIDDFGAVNDSTVLSTLAIQKAIDTAAQNKNGGLVIIPKGKYLSGSLLMKSGVTLYLEKEACLLGSTHPDDYQKLEFENAHKSPKQDDNSRLAFILAQGATLIAITGQGTIDGQGRELALTIDSLHHQGISIDPNYNTWHGRPSETARPKIINFSGCEHVTISDITIQDAACWVQSYELCNHLLIDHIKVHSRAYWNNDGMDITDCKNVRITNCDVNSADDGICLKSYYPGFYCDSVYIGDCTVRSSASAVKFGTASIGGFKNIMIENINVIDTYRSAIAIETVDGGFIENITVSDVMAVNTGNAIFVRLGNRSGGQPGTIKNIVLKNINVQVPFGRPDLAYDMRGPALPFFHNPFPSPVCGIPGHDIENITLENIEITYPGRASKGMAYIPLWRLDMVPEKISDYPEFSMFGELPSWGFYVRHVNGITMNNITLKLDEYDFRPAFVFDHVQNLVLQKINLPYENKTGIVFRDTQITTLDADTTTVLQIDPFKSIPH